MSYTVFLFPIRLGDGKIIEKKISRLLHKKLVLWRPFPFFDLIFMSSHDFNFRLTYIFLFAIFQESCRILKKSKDGGLRFSDEKLMSWRSNFDFPCRLQLFEENVLFEFIPNIQCDCAANKFTSFQNFDARNQLNPIRIVVSSAFAFHGAGRCIHGIGVKRSIFKDIEAQPANFFIYETCIFWWCVWLPTMVPWLCFNDDFQISIHGKSSFKWVLEKYIRMCISVSGGWLWWVWLVNDEIMWFGRLWDDELVTSSMHFDWCCTILFTFTAIRHALWS